MKYLLVVIAVLALVALSVAPVAACDYGGGGAAFSIVQQPVYAQQFAVQSYVQPQAVILQQNLGYGYGGAQAVVVRERFRRPVVVRERVVVPRRGLSVRVGGW